MDPSVPRRSASLQHAPPIWQNLNKEEATRRVINGESLAVIGIAGTGKTTYVKKLVEELKALGRKIDIIAKTHTASARAGGCTADHYVRRHILHGACSAEVIWVEEISQIETCIWAQLNKPPGIQWLLSGDFAQFPPFFDSWHGAAVHEEAFQRSSFFHCLAGGNMLRLTEGHRSDMELFNFYSSLIEGGQRFTQPLAQVLEAARAITGFEGPALKNLCISHRRRIILNRQLNKAFLPEDVVPRFVRARLKKGQMCAAQSMFLWPGIELLGCVQASRKGIRNNVLYTVTSLGEDVATVTPAEGEGDAIELAYPQVADFLRLSFAQTYASCQGTEFPGTLRLHDTANPHFTLRHLFVAMSRGKELSKLAIA